MNDREKSDNKRESEIDYYLRNMNQLINRLDMLREITDYQQRVWSGEFTDIDSVLVQKKIEDGVILSFGNASPEQIDMLKKQNFFKYYKDAFKPVEMIKIKSQIIWRY